MFLTVVTSVLVGLHLYVIARLAANLALTGTARTVTFAVVGGMFLLVMAAFHLSWRLPGEVATPLRWAGFLWMAMVMWLALALLAGDIIQLIAWILPRPLAVDPARRALLRSMLGFAALATTGALTLEGLREGTSRVGVRDVAIRLKRLPRELDGLRIVQITDLHMGPLPRGVWLQGVVAEVNALAADLVVITGDLVDGTVANLADQVRPIADLRARYGVYFVTGNHDYFDEVDAWVAWLRAAGIRTLRNERETIRIGAEGLPIDLAGVDDFRRGNPDLPHALAGRDADRLVILLAHQPAAIEEAAALGVDLQLSGHTHGGQVWPFGWVVRTQQPYISGLHTHPGSETQIYVSNGTGYWGPPLRLGAPAEITHLTLRAAA
jgi:hypothetical protein